MSDRELYLREKRRGFSVSGRTSKTAYTVIIYKYFGSIIKMLCLSVAFMVCSQVLVNFSDRLGISGDLIDIIAIFGFINLSAIFPFIACCYLIRMIPIVVRRLHDLGVSGYVLFLFIPLIFMPGGILLISLIILSLIGDNGNDGANRYGSADLGCGVSAEIHDEPVNVYRHTRQDRHVRNEQVRDRDTSNNRDANNGRDRYSGINSSLFE